MNPTKLDNYGKEESHSKNDSTFERCPHDAENPYSMISNGLIRDNSISPQCRWLLIFLLSNEKGWVINTSQIVNHLKSHKGFGRNNIRAIFKEAIDAGYMKRISYKDCNLKRHKYYVSERPKFSNNFTDAPNLGAPNLGRPKIGSDKNDYSSSLRSEDKKENNKKKSSSPPPSADAEDIYSFFLSSIRKKNEEFKEPDALKWKKAIDKMLKEDKRNPIMVKMILEWACAHDHWSGYCISPKSLSKNYDIMLIQMKNEKKKDTVFINRCYALSFYQANKNDMKGFAFNARNVVNTENAKDIEFSMPHEEFKERLEYIFGG